MKRIIFISTLFLCTLLVKGCEKRYSSYSLVFAINQTKISLIENGGMKTLNSIIPPVIPTMPSTKPKPINPQN